MKAVSGDERFDDSPLSNTLTISDSMIDDDVAGGRAGVLGGLVTSSGWPYDDDDDDDDGLPARVIRLTESAIHLDWSEYQAPSSLVYYRVVWTSTSNHAVRFVVIYIVGCCHLMNLMACSQIHRLYTLNPL